jgi:hypothetical protein
MLTATKTSGRVIPGPVEQAAKSRLAKTGYSRLKAVECSFRDGTLVLRGQVPTYYHKQLAQEALRNTTHVNQLINHLEVVS